MTATIEKLLDMIFDSMERNEWNEELLYDLSTEIVDKFDELLSNDLPEVFYELYDYVDSYWRGINNKDTQEHAFFMGRLYGVLDFVKRKYDELANEKLCLKYALKPIYYNVFSKISSYPGIIHNDLTNCTNGSKSALSQLIKKPEDDGLIKSVKCGREKHYYLTPLGMRVYQKAKVVQAKVAQEKVSNELSVTFDGLGINNNIAVHEKTNIVSKYKKIPVSKYWLQNTMKNALDVEDAFLITLKNIPELGKKEHNSKNKEGELYVTKGYRENRKNVVNI